MIVKNLIRLSVLFVLLCNAELYGRTNDSTSVSETEKFGFKWKLHGCNATLKDIEIEVTEADRGIVRSSFDLFSEYYLNDLLGLELALSYSGQGCQRPIWGYSNRIETKLDYIMLSAIPRFYLDKQRQLSIFIGPRVGWLVSAKEQLFLEGKKYAEVNLALYKLVRINWGFICGGDCEYESGFTIGIDCNVVLTHLREDETSRKRSLFISVGTTISYNFA